MVLLPWSKSPVLLFHNFQLLGISCPALMHLASPNLNIHFENMEATVMIRFNTWIQPMCQLTRFYVSYCALEPSVILMAGAPFFSFESCASLLKSVPFYMLLFSTNLMSDWNLQATRKLEISANIFLHIIDLQPQYWLRLCAMLNLERQLLSTNDFGKLVY